MLEFRYRSTFPFVGRFTCLHLTAARLRLRSVAFERAFSVHESHPSIECCVRPTDASHRSLYRLINSCTANQLAAVD